MRPFPEPILQRIPPTKDHRLIQTVLYVDWFRSIRIPAGFVYDKSSVPRLLHSLISPADLSDLAPLLHDYLYRTGGRGFPGTIVPDPVVRAIETELPYSRRQTDELFHEVMTLQGVNLLRARLAYLAVRWFGFFAWRSDKRHNA